MAQRADTDTKMNVQDASAFLRAAGQEAEAHAVESSPSPPRHRRLPTKPPTSEPRLVPIAEATARLGLSRNAVQRRIEIGLLDGIRDERDGYRFVTRASLDLLLENARTYSRLHLSLKRHPRHGAVRRGVQCWRPDTFLTDIYQLDPSAYLRALARIHALAPSITRLPL